MNVFHFKHILGWSSPRVWTNSCKFSFFKGRNSVLRIII